jgi:predicted PurR-regulated permease PerM
MTTKLTPGRLLAAAIVALSLWIVHGFIEAVLAACVIAIASWPLYAWFRSRLSPRLGHRTGAIVFTVAITVFVLAPMVFACWALLGEAHLLLLGMAGAERSGIPIPPWLRAVPAVGPWLARRWLDHLGHPDSLQALSQHTDPVAVLGWLQSLGQSTFHHALTIGFTVLLLCFLYQEGAMLAREAACALRHAVGECAERYVDVATRAVRASVNSMLLVGVFDGCATALAYAGAGAPRALLWAAITGALAAVPFLGYVAVAAMALQLAMQDASSPALLSLLLGCAVLLGGDKVVRPMVARGGIHLPFVWVLIGCLGGFEVLGLMGLVIGPTVLSLGRELWKQRQAGNGNA